MATVGLVPTAALLALSLAPFSFGGGRGGGGGGDANFGLRKDDGQKEQPWQEQRGQWLSTNLSLHHASQLVYLLSVSSAATHSFPRECAPVSAAQKSQRRQLHC